MKILLKTIVIACILIIGAAIFFGVVYAIGPAISVTILIMGLVFFVFYAAYIIAKGD